MMDRKEYARLWHLRNKERRNAAALARYHLNPAPTLARKARARAYMTDAERERVKARDRAYRASRKAKDREYLDRNKERIAKVRREAYLRRKAAKKKRDPIAAAKRLAEKAAKAAEAVRMGYTGRLMAA